MPLPSKPTVNGDKDAWGGKVNTYLDSLTPKSDGKIIKNVGGALVEVAVAAEVAAAPAVAANTAGVARVDPGDSPPDTMIVRDDTGRSVSVPDRVVYAVARGLVMGDAGAASANATILNTIMAAGKLALIPAGTCYIGASLVPMSNGGIVGAGRGATTLIATGSGNGMTCPTATPAYRTIFEGFTLQFGGTGTTAHGFQAQAWRYSQVDDVYITGFPGDGVHHEQSWTNRFRNTEVDRCGGHGWWWGDGSNAVSCESCIGSLNGLDGFHADKNARVVLLAPQAEANARHAYAATGAQSFTIIAPYVEHQDPSFWGVTFPTQSPRYVVYISSATDGTWAKHVNLVGGHLEGGAGAGATITDGIVYAENCYDLDITPGYAANTTGNRGMQIQPSVRRYRLHGRFATNADDTVANQGLVLGLTFDFGSGAKAVDRHGLLGAREGLANLLVNGGFEANKVGDTTVPPGWSNAGGGVLGNCSYETGTDGGRRLVFSGTGAATQPTLDQIVSGPAVRSIAQHGTAILSFDAIVPTTNVRGKAAVQVVCLDAGGTSVGGGLTSWVVPPNNSEVGYHLPFPVPATAYQIRVRLQAADFAATTDTIKLDRMMLTSGEVPKRFGTSPLTEQGGRLFAPVALPTKAGAFSDADFATTPPDNSLVGIDTTNGRVYIRTGGVYRYLTLT